MGDTSRAARNAGIDSIAPLDDPVEIEDILGRFVADPLKGTLPTAMAVENASRRGRTKELAALLESVI